MNLFTGVYTSSYVNVRMCMCIYACTHAFMNLYVYLSRFMCVSTCVCVCMHVHMYLCVCYCIYRCLRVCTHVYVDMRNFCLCMIMYIVFTYIEACVRAFARVFAFFDCGRTCYMHITYLLLCHFQSYIFTDRPLLYAR